MHNYVYYIAPLTTAFYNISMMIQEQANTVISKWNSFGSPPPPDGVVVSVEMSNKKM